MPTREVTVKIGADVSKFEREISKATAFLKKNADQMKKIGKSMTTFVTLPIAGVGVAMLKTAADFETGMNRVQALTGASAKDFKALETQAKKLGKTTQFSARQAADGMGFLAQAGFKADQIVGAMPSTLQLAAAAQIDLGTAADITSNILTGFNKEVSELGEVNDILVKAFTKSNTNLEALGEGMKFVGPAASSLGIPLKEVVAALGALGDAGIPASQAGTALRQSLAKLATPTKATSDELDRLGVSVTDSAGNLKSLTETIGLLEGAGVGFKESVKLVGIESATALTALVTKGSKSLGEFVEVLDNAGGTAERIAKTQMKGLNGAIKWLQSAWEGLSIAVASSGLLEMVTGLVESIAEFTGKLSDTEQKILLAVAAFGALAAAVGPVLLTFGTLIASPILLKIAGITAAVLALAAAFKALTSEAEKAAPKVTKITGGGSLVEDAKAGARAPKSLKELFDQGGGLAGLRARIRADKAGRERNVGKFEPPPFDFSRGLGLGEARPRPERFQFREKPPPPDPTLLEHMTKAVEDSIVPLQVSTETTRALADMNTRQAEAIQTNADAFNGLTGWIGVMTSGIGSFSQILGNTGGRVVKFAQTVGHVINVLNALKAAETVGTVVRTFLGFADGGLVRGAGSGTSDSVPIRASAGEFVMTKRATDSIGAGNLAQMNSSGKIASRGGGGSGTVIMELNGRVLGKAVVENMGDALEQRGG